MLLGRQILTVDGIVRPIELTRYHVKHACLAWALLQGVGLVESTLLANAAMSVLLGNYNF